MRFEYGREREQGWVHTDGHFGLSDGDSEDVVQLFFPSSLLILLLLHMRPPSMPASFQVGTIGSVTTTNHNEMPATHLGASADRCMQTEWSDMILRSHTRTLPEYIAYICSTACFIADLDSAPEATWDIFHSSDRASRPPLSCYL